MRAKRSFLRDEVGAVLAEGLIVMPLILLVFAAFIEFGFAMFQWNQTVKAMQLGARTAVVSDWMISAADQAALFPTAPSSALVGQGIPADGASRSCSSSNGDAECVAGLARLVNGSGGWQGMRAFNPNIGLANVVVTYERSGLGYYGRPSGGVVTVRLSARNIQFNLPLIGALIGLNTITIPAMPVTMTSEDMKTASGT